MKYRDRDTGQIYNLYELQTKFSHVSFPVVWTSDTYEFANVDPVLEVVAPAIEDVRYVPRYAGVQLIDGVWTESWDIVPKFDSPDEQTAWEIECKEIQWNTVRGQRDALLALTDYTQLIDAPITTECRTAFANYRQQLRNITIEQTDPYNIVWPIAPIYEKE